MQENWNTQKVTHTLRLRLLEVKAKQQLGPDLIRITLGGSDLRGFYSPGFDDHVKLLIPQPGGKVPLLPQMSERGMVFPVGQTKPILRDYTPRSYRESTQELDIDFVLHGQGPACHWASVAQEGDKIGVAGPRGSLLIPTGFDWHILMGDETALPAMARRLQELGTQQAIHVFVLARNLQTVGTLNAPEYIPVHWVPSILGGQGLLDSVSALPVLPGRGFVWIASESSMATTLRAYWVNERGHNKKWIRAASYWRHGAQAVHEEHED